VFGVEGRNFLGFMLTHKGIEANPDKCRLLSNAKPTTINEGF